MKHILLMSLFAFAFGASAEVQFIKITGASSVSLNVAGVTTIFGGLAGDACEDSPAPCNSCDNVSCATAPFCSCNTTRIGDNQVVSIQVKSDANVHGRWALTDVGGTPQYLFGEYTKGKTANLSIKWGQLCNGNSGNGATCEGPTFNAGLLLGITDGSTMLESGVLQVVTVSPAVDVIDDCTDYNGAICGFQVTSDKHGVHLKNYMADEAWPAYASKIRVFASTKDFSHASPTDATFTQDLTVNDDGSIKDELKFNPTEMTFFRLATVDMANNISNFISDKNILDPAFGSCSSLTDREPNGGCRYRFNPQSHKK